MALMIPDSLPRQASSGERFLYNKLRDALPDDFIVWHEPRVESRRPDFIILSPCHGLLVVEAKGWSATMIKEGDSKQILIEWPGKNGAAPSLAPTDHPLEQAEKYKYTLMDQLKAEPILLNDDPSHRGKICFPIGRCVMMTGMKRSDLEKKHPDGTTLKPLFSDPSIQFRDELDEWASLSDREVIRQFWDLFDARAKFGFDPLTDDQTQTIKGVLNPSTQIRRVPATQQSWNQDTPVPVDATIIKGLMYVSAQALKPLIRTCFWS